MQSSVRDSYEQVFAGMVQSDIWANHIITRIAKTTIPFGLAVTIDAVAEVTIDEQYCDLPESAGEVAYCLGVAIADITKEEPASYAALESVPIMQRGKIWVESGDAVNDLSKGVYVRRAVDAGTQASITDTTTYPCGDQDGKTEKFTIGGDAAKWGEQTVLFAGATTTAAGVAAQLNAGIKGASFAVVGGQVVGTVDEASAAATIANGTGTATLTWGTPVAGSLDTTSKGSFRATTATGYTQWTGARWVAGRTDGGKYYGLLEVNLP